jgi:hypothetical protein
MFDDLVDAFEENEVLGVYKPKDNERGQDDLIFKVKIESPKAVAEDNNSKAVAECAEKVNAETPGQQKPEKPESILTRSQVLSLQGELISYYNMASFQEDLRDLVDAAAGDERELDVYRSQLIQPIQHTLAKKYKIEGSPADVQKVAVLSGGFENHHSVAMNMCKIAHLLQQTKHLVTERNRAVSKAEPRRGGFGRQCTI